MAVEMEREREIPFPHQQCQSNEDTMANFIFRVRTSLKLQFRTQALSKHKIQNLTLIYQVLRLRNVVESLRISIG